MDPALLQLELLTAVDQKFVSMLICESKANEVVHKPAEFIEDKVLVCSTIVYLVLLLQLEHTLQLLESFLQEILAGRGRKPLRLRLHLQLFGFSLGMLI